MRTRSIAIGLLTGALGCTLGLLGHHFGGNAHVRRKLGQPALRETTCFQCHFVSTSRLLWAKPRPHHDSPGGLAVSPDGNRIYIALEDRDEVAEADVNTRQEIRRVKVATGPHEIAIDAAGKHLYVTCRGSDRVAVLELPSLVERESVPVGDGPTGIAWCHTSDGERLVVANSLSDSASVIALSPTREISRPSMGREPYAVTAAADGSRVYVASRMVGLTKQESVPASELTILDPINGRVVGRKMLGSAHLSEGECVVPSRNWLLTPIVKVRNLVPITQVADGWVMSSGLAITDLRTGQVVQVPLDEANDFFADPSGIAVDPGGRRAFVASGGCDRVTVVDLERLANWLQQADADTRREAINDLSLSPEYVVARLPTWRNPRQVVMSPKGDRFFVSERLQDSVLVVDATSLQPLGRIRLGNGGPDDPIHRGEQVFTSAEYTFQHQFSCRSCHPDGHVDGLSYDFDGHDIGDNLLDNRSLQGVAGTAPFKWNGKNPTLEVQCGPRFARVLMRTEPFPPAQLRDLTTFIESLPPPRYAQKRQAKLTPAQERGRAIFFATQTPGGKEIPVARRCVTCHPPPLYTVRLPFEVGTKGPRDSSGLFDTPHLLGVAYSAPYLHDGRAQTLEELWTIYNPDDKHGVSSYMNKIQLNDLIEFLKSL